MCKEAQCDSSMSGAKVCRRIARVQRGARARAATSSSTNTQSRYFSHRPPSLLLRYFLCTCVSWLLSEISIANRKEIGFGTRGMHLLLCCKCKHLISRRAFVVCCFLYICTAQIVCVRFPKRWMPISITISPQLEHITAENMVPLWDASMSKNGRIKQC